MRKAVGILLLLLSIFAYGDNIPERTARAVAEGFFNNGTLTKSSDTSIELVWDGEPIGTKAGSDFEPAFYVYNNDGSFVIVSGDDAVTPILAYSYEGNFVLEGMPGHIAAWFEAIRDFINKAREEGYKPLDSTVKAWNDIKANKPLTAGTPVTYYETAKWDQDAPYNNLCPKDGGSNSYTGCAATAQAIVMRYHNYPEKGNGTTAAYYTDTRRIHIEANDISGHIYDWGNMPLEYSNKWTSEQRKQVAQLMYDCGTALEMDYTSEGSGANGYSYRPELINHFSYSPDCYYMSANAYSTSDWEDCLKAELDANGPIIYTAYLPKYAGGHAFVLDGYDSQNYFHINFGWSGQEDSYCKFPEFKAGSDNFCLDHSAIFSLYPARGGESGDIVVWLEASNTVNVLKASVSNFEKGVGFSVKTGNIMWSVANNGNFEMAMLHTDYYGNVKEEVSDVVGVKASNSNYYDSFTFNCKISKSIAELDKLILGYRTNQGEWKPVICPHGDGTVDAIQLGEQGIDAQTNFSYNKETGIITMTSVTGTIAYAYDSSGKEVTDGVKYSRGIITIDTTLFPKGEYKIVISRSGSKKSFIIRTGE